LTLGTTKTISTSWARYSFTVNIPSISGKTLGTAGNDYLGFFIFTSCGTGLTGYSTDVGVQNATIGIWGIQMEAGSTATTFQTATGTIQGELAACQRYYYRLVSGVTKGLFGLGQAVATSGGYAIVNYPVPMRIAPSTLEQTGTASNYAVWNASSSDVTCSAVPSILSTYSTVSAASVNFSVSSGLVAGNAVTFYANSSTTAFLGFSAEL
jgi:hypothetical protein